MVPIEAKLIFSTAMCIFALAVWLANRPREKPSFSNWMIDWVPRFDFMEDRIDRSVTQHFYIGFFLVWIPIVWLFD